MRPRNALLAGLAALVASVGAVAALSRVADELPEPIATAARLSERLWTRILPPRVPKRDRLAGLTAPEQDAVRALAGRLNGRIVWSSNRGGDHELYLLDLPSRSLQRLTRHPNVDFLPRFSPDGRQIVFLRSQKEWVSFRDPSAWDVFVIGADGTGERLIARSGYHPSWSADGEAILFHRGARLVRYDLASRRESLLFDGTKEVAGMTEIGDFELAPDQRHLAFGLRGPFAGAAVFDLDTRRVQPLTRVQACQTTWAPDGRSVVWVEIGGHGGTRVMIGGPDGSKRRVLMDLPGAYSHEYFPKLSNDGAWLIWGAAAEGHEHDRADYEIFLWELGTAWEAAVRLTHHVGNDQWPDLHVKH
jgi:Tol biopolymer transport system component